jgi:poly(hydroxyalkanoate) depolymerase family esterase
MTRASQLIAAREGARPADITASHSHQSGLMGAQFRGCTPSESFFTDARCTQSAAGFALLLPQQQRSNNPNGYFNWFQSGDIERGRGEALSIRQMVKKMVSDHGVDRTRVFVTGLSAGGAMTPVFI